MTFERSHGAPAVKRRAVVYILVCSDGSLYAGWSLDLVRRLRSHLRGRAARYTRSRLPVALAGWWFPESLKAARSQEAHVKRLTRAKKLSLLNGDEAFGARLHKAPVLATANEGTMTVTAPQQSEIGDYAGRARTSRARIATDRGDLVFTFFEEEAPQHVAAFMKLAESGFYDGLTFHRVEPGFVIQGGDPRGDGTGGPGYQLKAEFNGRPHLRGTVAMARSSQPDSAGSQFYICLQDARFLDRQYTVFGQMTEGFEALDAVRRGDAMKSIRIEPRLQ